MIDEMAEFEVSDRNSFIKFLEILRQDFLTNSDSWENQNLDDFLEAMIAYTEDIQGYYDNTNQNVDADQPSWKVFADIFKGSTVYE